jgi:TrmH family RNA methyltransferase
MNTFFSKSYLKNIKKLSNKKEILAQRKFIVQGEKSVLQVLASDWEVESVISTENFYKKYTSQIKSKTQHYLTIEEKNIASLGGIYATNNTICVAKVKDFYPKTTSYPKIILDHINDPGNLGTIIRIADWFGVKEVVCSDKSVYLYNPKVLQASMGSFLNVEISYVNLLDFLPKLTIPVYGADLSQRSIHSASIPPKSAIVLGSESHGISDNIRQFFTESFTILPHPSTSAESLNVAVAAGIVAEKIWGR